MYTKPNFNLMTTSGLFIVPALLGIYKKEYFLSSVSFITTIASFNYWRDPIPGTRKNIDLIVSKSAGLIYFVHGYNNLSGMMRLIGYTNGFVILLSYCTSVLLYKLKSNGWINYHMAFHISIVFGKMIVLIKKI